MASEGALRRYTRQQVEAAYPGAHVEQVENSANTGTPDTYLRAGRVAVWLELKEVAPPKRFTTGVRCPHYTMDQVRWAAREWRAGGRCYVLLQLGRAYLLLHPKTAAGLRTGRHTVAELRERAVAVWDGTLPGNQLLTTLREDI